VPDKAKPAPGGRDCLKQPGGPCLRDMSPESGTLRGRQAGKA
jgi:hypothetical protein